MNCYCRDIWRKLFWDSRWNIGYREKKGLFVNTEGNYTVFPFESKNIWYADPFLAEDHSKNYIFCEAYLNNKEKGCIAVWEIGDQNPPSIIIENDYHMSFPCVFQINNNWYMIPETSENKSLELYQAIQFPYKWRKSKILLEGKKLVDSVLYEEDKQYFILSYDPILFELLIFSFEIDKLSITQIYSHKYQDNAGRPAGKLFRWNMDIIRPSQDCRTCYGKNIIFYKLDPLSSGRFDEVYIKDFDRESINVDGNRNIDRIHTYNSNQSYEVIDYAVSYFDLFKRLKILRRNLKRKNR